MLLRKMSQLSGKYNGMNLPISICRYCEWIDMVEAGQSPSADHFFPDLNEEQRHFMETGIVKEEIEQALGVEEKVND